MLTVKQKTFNSDELVKIRKFFGEGTVVCQEISDLRESLRETTKNLAKDLDIKPSVLSRALKAHFRSDIENQKEEFEDVESLIEMASKKPGV